LGQVEERASRVGENATGFPAEDYESFHRELSEIRRRIIASMHGLSEPEAPGEAERKQRQKESMPLMPLEPERLEDPALVGYAREILEIAVRHGVLAPDESGSLIDALGELEVGALAVSIARRETGPLFEACERTGVASDALLFVGEHLARAILTWHAGPLGDLVDPDLAIRSGSCPVCGNLPRFSCLDAEDAVRTLVCGMCETSWRYRRIGCPFCGNEDQKKLRHFTVGKEPGYRVDVCDECKRYLKQVDLRKVRDEDAALADLDIASARLDLLAWREGYR